MGSSVAHDSHNLIIAGTNPRDMLVCARALAEHGGGFVASAEGAVRAILPLPVAGLLSLDRRRRRLPPARRGQPRARGAGLPARRPRSGRSRSWPCRSSPNCGSRPRACSTSSNSSFLTL